jgi:nucleotidyltransferase/DNA polymerase involved in DNA repair
VWALRYAPIATADPPDGLVIDATGAAHLHGGEAAMLTDMVGRLFRLHRARRDRRQLGRGPCLRPLRYKHQQARCRRAAREERNGGARSLCRSPAPAPGDDGRSA